MNKTKQMLLLAFGLIVPLFVAAEEDASRLEKRHEKLPEPKSTLQPLVFPIDEKLPPAQAEALRFTLKELTLKGNTAFSVEELAPLYAQLVGKEVTLLDIYNLRDAITAKYGNAGFGLSKAIIPEQRIQAEGLVRIDVIEGFIDEVIVEGASAEQQEFLSYAIEQIKAERPFKADILERYLLLANDRFAIKVTSTMKQSEKTPAASTLILKVEPATKLEGGASLDNRGTDAVGTNQINANLAVNGLGGRASQTTLNYATVEQGSELQYIALNHTEVLGNEGTALTLGWAENIQARHRCPAVARKQKRQQNRDAETVAPLYSHPPGKPYRSCQIRAEGYGEQIAGRVDLAR